MEYLCKCNMCDTILIDKNPQVDAKKIEIHSEMNVLLMEKNEDGYWVCPNCNTDDYLSDDLKIN